MSENIFRIQRGEPSPDFETRTVSGKPFSLSGLEGRLVWLIFYRYPGCPICNLHLKAVFNRAALFEKKGVEVVAIYDSPASAFPKDWEGYRTACFTAIPDPDRVLYKAYGVEQSNTALLSPKVVGAWISAATQGIFQKKITGNVNQLPANFLISQDGTVEYVHYGRNAADHMPWQLLDKFVQEFEVKNWGAGESVVI